MSVVLCIDVEPDARLFDRDDPRPWLGFERLIERLPALRRRLSEATGAAVTFTWCVRMDPQVAETWGSPTWVADTYGDALAGLVQSGDELGLHTHTFRWAVDARQWIADYEDEAWGEHSVTSALDAFEMAFGRSCAVHRGGDHFLSGAMLACLETRGVKVDLTVEPGYRPVGAPEGELSRGLCPDYRGIPTRPYRSSPGRFPAPELSGNEGPLFLPVLSAPGRRFLQRSTLSPDVGSVRFVTRLATELLRSRPPVVVMAIRSSAALGPGWDSLANNLEHLGRHRGASFVTATAALDRLETAPGTYVSGDLQPERA